MPGVVCIQQGLEESTDQDADRKEVPPASRQGNPGVVLVQQGGATPAVEKAAAMMLANSQHQGKWTNSRGKPIIRFHCGRDHPVLECNDIPLEEREKFMVTKNAKWVERKAA